MGVRHLKESQVIQVMLEELIQRQNKFTRLEKAKFRWAWFLSLCGLVFIILIYHVMTIHEQLQGTNLLSILTDQQMFIFLSLILIVGLIQFKHLVKKSNKAEDEFEELRLEIIERNAELWEEDILWEDRHAVFSFMKKEHDINLYHK